MPIFEALKTTNMVRLRQVQLAGWDDFRTVEWLELVEHPKIMSQQTAELLNASII